MGPLRFFFSGIAALLALLLGGTQPLGAHEYPLGDTNPFIFIEDGAFAVYNTAGLDLTPGSNTPVFCKRTYSTSGELLVPRHRVPPERARELSAFLEKRYPGEFSAEPHVIVDSLKSKPEHIFQLSQFHAEKLTLRPLPVEFPKEGNAFVSESLLTETEVGFLWSNIGGKGKDAGVTLRLSVAGLQGFAPGRTVEIGKAAGSNDHPPVSNLVWAAGFWWVAWIRDDTPHSENAAPDSKAGVYHTVLSSVDSVSGQVTHHVMPGNSDWNTSLSLATHGGWLCTAWSAVDPEDAPIANIVTAFYHVDK